MPNLPPNCSTSFCISQVEQTFKNECFRVGYSVAKEMRRIEDTKNPPFPSRLNMISAGFFILQFDERTKGYIELWKSTLLVMAITSWCGIWRNLSTLLLWLAQAACLVTLIGIPFSDPLSTCYLLTICVVEVIKCHDI